MANRVPKPTNGNKAKEYIDKVENDVRREMLQRVFDMLIITLGQLSNQNQDRYRELYIGEFDVYLYILLMDKLLQNKILLEDYLNGEFTNRNEL
ncbi:MAG: hypothetical protein AAF125_01975 [Chloroflexota bacterium]